MCFCVRWSASVYEYACAAVNTWSTEAEHKTITNLSKGEKTHTSGLVFVHGHRLFLIYSAPFRIENRFVQQLRLVSNRAEKKGVFLHDNDDFSENNN